MSSRRSAPSIPAATANWSDTAPTNGTRPRGMRVKRFRCRRSGATVSGRSKGFPPQRVGAVLTIVRGLDPDRYRGLEPTLEAFRAALGCTMVLVGLRAAAAAHLRGLPTPVGFNHCALPSVSTKTRNRRQQSTGRDPPPGAAWLLAGQAAGTPPDRQQVLRPDPPTLRATHRRCTETASAGEVCA